MSLVHCITAFCEFLFIHQSSSQSLHVFVTRKFHMNCKLCFQFLEQRKHNGTFFTNCSAHQLFHSTSLGRIGTTYMIFVTLNENSSLVTFLKKFIGIKSRNVVVKFSDSDVSEPGSISERK